MFTNLPRTPDPKIWEQYQARRDDRRESRIAHAREAERPATGLEAGAVYRNPEGQLFAPHAGDDGRWYLLPHPLSLQFSDPELFYVISPNGKLIECDSVARTIEEVEWDLITITGESAVE